MKNTKICPKCNSADIVRVNGTVGAHGTGNNIMIGAAMFATNCDIEEAMTRRIRIMLRIATKNGHTNLVLGAWGCGAFGNKPEDVSSYFKKVLIDEEYGRCFDAVRFAIYGRTDGKNIRVFREKFEC